MSCKLVLGQLISQDWACSTTPRRSALRRQGKEHQQVQDSLAYKAASEYTRTCRPWFSIWSVAQADLKLTKTENDLEILILTAFIAG